MEHEDNQFNLIKIISRRRFRRRRLRSPGSCSTSTTSSHPSKHPTESAHHSSEPSHPWHSSHHAGHSASAASTHLAGHLGDQSHHLGVVLVLHDVGRVAGDVFKCCRHLGIREGRHQLRVIEKPTEATHSSHTTSSTHPHVIILALTLGLLGGLGLGLPRPLHPLLSLGHLLLSNFPLLLTLVLQQLLGIGLDLDRTRLVSAENIIVVKPDLFQPLVRLLVEVDLAGGGEILGGLREVAEQPLGAASPLVGSRVVRVELDGSGAVLELVRSDQIRSEIRPWLTFTQALVDWGEILR